MTRLACLTLGIAICITLPPLQDDKEDDLRDQLEQEMDRREWKAAGKTARTLKGMLRGDERDEMEAVILRIKGEAEWEKVMKAKKDGKKPSKILSSLRKFTKKFGKDEELLERAREMEEVVIAPYVDMVADFEGDTEDTFLGNGAGIVTEPRKQGKCALQWSWSDSDSESLYIASQVQDWSDSPFVSMWIHSKRKGSRLTIDVVSDVDDFYECWSNIDWVGWKLVRLPLRGRGARFATRGKPSWGNIIAMRFWKDEGTPIDIVIDDIRIERPIP